MAKEHPSLDKVWRCRCHSIPSTCQRSQSGPGAVARRMISQRSMKPRYSDWPRFTSGEAAPPCYGRWGGGQLWSRPVIVLTAICKLPICAAASGGSISPSPKFHFTLERLIMARKKNRDIAWERAATVRGKNPRAWRRDDRGNRIRYGSFETRGKYAWTLQRGKLARIAQHA
jgi:hypothetical protein